MAPKFDSTTVPTIPIASSVLVAIEISAIVRRPISQCIMMGSPCVFNAKPSWLTCALIANNRLSVISLLVSRGKTIMLIAFAVANAVKHFWTKRVYPYRIRSLAAATVTRETLLLAVQNARDRSPSERQPSTIRRSTIPSVFAVVNATSRLLSENSTPAIPNRAASRVTAIVLPNAV